MDIARIIKELKARGRFPKLSRAETVCNPDELKELVSALGKQITPGFVLDEKNGWLYGQLARWAVGMPFEAVSPNDMAEKVPGQPAGGIVIAGNVGSGKSVALKIAKLLCEVSGAKLYINSTPEKMDWKEQRSTDITTDFAVNGTLEDYCKCRILCIQDLGAEPAETLYMGNRIPVLRQILESRGDNPLLMTLATTNLTPPEIQNVYGERVRSRLFEMCNFLPLVGPDRRHNAATA